MRAIIVAGGTGGHIYPAVAIINKIKEQDKNSEILYIGTTDRMEKDIIPDLNIPYVGIKMEGLNRHHLLSNIKVLIDYKNAVKKAKEEIKKFKPDIVVGAGGYITAPVLYAAHRLKVKTLIHEQNSIPGISNKFLAKFVDKICVSLPGSISYFPKEKVSYTGNPRSEEIIKLKAYSKEKYGLDKSLKLVVIVMGSLGSVTMTQKIKELIPEFSNKHYQVLIITGKAYYEEYKEINHPKNVVIVPYLEDFNHLLKSSDLLISRAGASTIAEITAIGLPSILVPSPYVTNNHQYKNAKELEDIGACNIVLEHDFSKEVLIPSIDEILTDEKKYQRMKTQAKSLGVVDSATKIYKCIEELIG